MHSISPSSLILNLAITHRYSKTLKLLHSMWSLYFFLKKNEKWSLTSLTFWWRLLSDLFLCWIFLLLMWSFLLLMVVFNIFFLFMFIAEEWNGGTNNNHNKRRRSTPNQTIINCDLYINLEGNSSSMVIGFFDWYHIALFSVLFFFLTCKYERALFSYCVS